MKLDELPRNTRMFLDWAHDELDCDADLVIEGGEVRWDLCAEGTMDEVEGLQEKGLVLETVEAEETNLGFGFRAVSADGTEWTSGPLDCHDFAKGQKVGRFPDGSGHLVIVRRK